MNSTAGPARAEQPPLDLGDLEVRIDGMVDVPLPAGAGPLGTQGVDAGLE